jgi:hypothetical protein
MREGHGDEDIAKGRQLDSERGRDMVSTGFGTMVSRSFSATTSGIVMVSVCR